MSESVEDLQRQVADVPEEHRRLIARWLLALRGQYRPSLVLTSHEANLIVGVLTGAVTELCDPLSEDTTLLHAAEVVEELTNPSRTS